MKKFALTPIFACLLIIGWANGTHDKEVRCEAIMAPFTADQSFAERVSEDLLLGVWKIEKPEKNQFLQFNADGETEIISNMKSVTEFDTYKWSVFQIGEVVYLRMDGGVKDDDHLYIVRQNCDGLILDHTFTNETSQLLFLRSKHEKASQSLRSELIGQWVDPIDENNFQLTLKENGEFIFMNQRSIDTGQWKVFDEGPFLMLYGEDSNKTTVLPVKHIDFMNLDLIITNDNDNDRSKIISLEKKYLLY